MSKVVKVSDRAYEVIRRYAERLGITMMEAVDVIVSEWHNAKCGMDSGMSKGAITDELKEYIDSKVADVISDIDGRVRYYELMIRRLADEVSRLMLSRSRSVSRRKRLKLAGKQSRLPIE